MVCVVVHTTLIASPIPKKAVAIIHKNQKLKSESFSLNPKYPITKFLNLKLMFQLKSTTILTKIINKLLKRCPLNNRTEREISFTGEILINGNIRRNKASAQRYRTNTFWCLVNLQNFWANFEIFSGRLNFLFISKQKE